jgi:DNA mismatch repair protein MutL
LKFLKTDVTERRAIDNLVTRYAVAYPRVRFKLSSDGSLTLQTAGDGDRRAILAALYGVEAAKQMLEVLAEEEGCRLTGFISPVSLTRSNRKDITFFVNGRWVQDVPLTTALLQAYHTLLMVGRYPLTTLFLEMHPELVDVNVHPTKAEVRFRNQDKAFSFVQRAARRALLAYTPVPGLTTAVWGGAPRRADPAWKLAHEEGHLPGGRDGSTGGADRSYVDGGQPSVTSGKSSVPGGQMSASLGVPLLRLIGQIGATYLVAEGPDGLYLIDQHAAHERVLFEKLMAQRASKNIPSQALLSPVVVQLPPAQAGLLEGQLDVLGRFGFTAETFGTNTVQVRAIPVLFGGGDPSAALRALVEDFEEDETPLGTEVERRLAGRVCKRLAVKAGQVLSPDEQRLLPTRKPADRPNLSARPSTMIHISVDMLEQQFGRRRSAQLAW